MYGDSIITSGKDQPFLTNSTQLPVDFTDDAVRHKSTFLIVERTTLENIEIIPFIDENGDEGTACVGGDCKAVSIDGDIEVHKLLKGTKVLLGDDTFGTVKCIVESESRKICNIGSLIITEYHPIKEGSVWKFPNTISNAEKLDEEIKVYSILLEEANDSGIMIENYPIAPFGHNNKTDSVIGHPFFGDHQLVSDSLMRFDQNAFEKGFIGINGVTRDENTGLINGFH
jgi:hypothetical protein